MIYNVLIHRLKEVINSPKLDQFKTEQFDELLPMYQKLGLENWYGDSIVIGGNMSVCQDRTRTLPHYLKMSGWEPLPEIDPNFKTSFRDIALAEAKKIVERANGQQIGVSWSGGLDSTCALFALLHYADPKQIMVFCNYNSIVESGRLFDTYIRGRGIRYSLTTPLQNPEFGDGLIVTGYLGDQLFGKLQTIAPEQFKHAWRDNVRPEQVPILEQIMDNYPVKNIELLPDFLEFVEMNFKWQMGKWNRMRNMPKSIADRMINFYEPVDFQRWSLGKYEEMYRGTDLKTYKMPLRVLLRELLESDEYVMNKIVQTSHYHILQHDWVMLLENGDNLYLKDFQ
jgi:hypothetical protein